MKYALISDIHGNYHALMAILDDAKTCGADRFLFLGDYYEDFPFPNEVVNTLRSLENAVIIRGNKEDYLVNLSKQDPSGWIYEQFAPIYWNYRELTDENRSYLMTLPEKATVTLDNGVSLYMTHSSELITARPRIFMTHSTDFCERMYKSPFTHEAALADFRQDVLKNRELTELLLQKPVGIYAYGHNHVQCYVRVGSSLFVNPGSGGAPLDFNTAAPYTILETADNDVKIHERRVPYDTAVAIDALLNSSLYEAAPVWSSLIAEVLKTGEEHLNYFLCHVEATAQALGYTQRPVSNEIYRHAYATLRREF